MILNYSHLRKPSYIVPEENAREQILHFLGFEPEAISEIAMNYKDAHVDGDSPPPQNNMIPQMVRFLTTIINYTRNSYLYKKLLIFTYPNVFLLLIVGQCR